MTSPSTAFSELRSLATRKLSGEFIAAGDDLEVHIFLQSGRLAWATSSRASSSFRDHLATQFGISADRLRALVTECRRDRTPLGEALIARQWLTRAQVAEALKAQVVTAVGSLEGELRTMFLQRASGFAEYDPTLTFTLDDVTPALPPQVRPAELVAQVAAEAPWLQWVEHLSATGERTRSTQKGGGPDARFSQLTLGHGDLVVLRHGNTTVVGAALEGGASIWAALDAPARLGQATPLFARLSNRPPPVNGALETSHEMVGTSCLDAEAALEVLKNDREVLAAGVVGTAACGAALFGRKGLPLAVMLERAIERRPLFPVSDEGNVFNGPLIAVRETPGWWFGTPLPSHEATVWLMTDAAVAPGLGWAVLRSVARQWQNEHPAQHRARSP